ncbi:zinc dependent phospholipase C family protein [Vibrio sp.]|nr:zinc dependent phospholipase C family protein [Vibrio sp.]
MPGAFAHITAVNKMILSDYFVREFDSDARRILTMNQPFMELGSLAPDFPYLVFGNKPQALWADIMHSSGVNSCLIEMIQYVKSLQGQSFAKAYAWLSGYLAHIVADITIHPVIERTVGHYKENKNLHRVCEMHQDAHIWHRMGLGDIGNKERVSRTLECCSGRDSPLDPILIDIWSLGLLSIDMPNKVEMPNIRLWFESFQKVINVVEDNYQLFPFSRHVAAFVGLKYPDIKDIQPQFINNLPTPAGRMPYDELFDLCVDEVGHYLNLLWNSVVYNGDLDWIKQWNLDIGEDENGVMTIWDKYSTRQRA